MSWFGRDIKFVEEIGQNKSSRSVLVATLKIQRGVKAFFPVALECYQSQGVFCNKQ